MPVLVLDINDFCLRPQKAQKSGGRAAGGVTLRLCAGEVALVLGLEREGQNKLMAAVAGLAPAYKQILVSGFPAGSAEAKRLIGYVPEGPCLYQEMTCGQYLETFAEINGLERHYRPYVVSEALAVVRMQNMADTVIGTITDGFQRRCLALARALVNNPRLVIIDGALFGVGNLEMRMFAEILNDIRQSGKAIIMSGHQLGGLENVVEKVCYLNNGEVFLQGQVADVVDDILDYHLFQIQTVRSVGCYRGLAKYERDPRVVMMRVHPTQKNLLYMIFRGGLEEYAQILTDFTKNGVQVVSNWEDTAFFGPRVN